MTKHAVVVCANHDQTHRCGGKKFFAPTLALTEHRTLAPTLTEHRTWLKISLLVGLCLLGGGSGGCRKQPAGSSVGVLSRHVSDASVLPDVSVLPDALGGVFSPRYPVRVRDDRGRVLVFARSPQRIVIAGPALYSEILVDLRAQHRVVGVVDTPNHPVEVQHIPRIGRVWPLSIEKVLSLRPDLVLGTFEPHRTQLETAGKVLVFTGGKTNAVLHSIADIFTLIRQIDRIVHGHSQRAERLIQDMNTQLQDLQRRIRRTRKKRVAVFYVPQPNSAQIYMMSRSSPGHELLEMAGGINVFARYTGWATNIEVVLQENPDLIITDPAQVALVKTHHILQTLTAVKTGQVHGIRASSFTSSRLVAVFQQLIHAIHGSMPTSRP